METAFAGISGALIGSFLNVVVYRLPLGQSLVKPRSHCPKCEEPVSPRDNVPVLSWLWLRGHCRHWLRPFCNRRNWMPCGSGCKRCPNLRSVQV